MADKGNGGDGGDVVDRLEDEGGPIEIETEDRTTTMEVASQGATVEGGDDEGPDPRPEVEDEGDGRACEGDPHVLEEIGAVGPAVEPLGSSIAVGGSVTIGDSSGGARGSGASGEDVGPSQSPLRVSARVRAWWRRPRSCP